MENWKSVVSRGELFLEYFVSDMGNVRSCRTTKKFPEESRLLLPFFNGIKYLRVDLVKDGKRFPRLVHKLVLEAFVGPCPAGKESCHGPTGCLDNRLTNLSWGTRQQNMIDRTRDGTDNRGVRCGTHKLTETEAQEIRRMLVQGVSQRKIALQYGLAQQTISSINRKVIWSWLD